MPGEWAHALTFVVIFMLGVWGGIVIMALFNMSRNQDDDVPCCVRIGPYKIFDYDSERCYISHASGEGGVFPKSDLLEVVNKFYVEKF